MRELRRFHALAVCSHLVSGPFHLPSGVLCSFRSRYYCAIGLETYLGLDVGGTQIRARYPTHATQDTRNHPLAIPLRGYHALRRPVPGDFKSCEPGVPGSATPHLLSITGRIRIALWPFPSPVLRPSRLVSFPPPTRMFYFSGFPFSAENACRSKQDSHSRIHGSKSPCNSPWHIAAWHALRRRSSRAIHQTA